eukprot:302022-Amphidinium_carterae.1
MCGSTCAERKTREAAVHEHDVAGAKPKRKSRPTSSQRLHQVGVDGNLTLNRRGCALCLWFPEWHMLSATRMGSAFVILHCAINARSVSLCHAAHGAASCKLDGPRPLQTKGAARISGTSR